MGRARASIVAVAPAVMLAGFAYHPHIGNPMDADFLANLAAAVAADPGRWVVAHYAVAVGSALMMLAYLAVRSHVRAVGQERWSGLAMPFIIFGSTLFAMLPAMEFAPLAATRAGGDAAATQGALFTWFVPTLLTGAALFFVGTLGVAVDVARSRIPSAGSSRLVVAALIVMAASRFVPLSFVQFYVQGVAGILALWPIAYGMWTKSQAVSVPYPTGGR